MRKGRLQLQPGFPAPAAARLASALPDEVGLISRARVHLWAGQYADAILLTDSGRFQPGLSMTDRYRLTLIRANLTDANHGRPSYSAGIAARMSMT